VNCPPEPPVCEKVFEKLTLPGAHHRCSLKLQLVAVTANGELPIAVQPAGAVHVATALALETRICRITISVDSVPVGCTTVIVDGVSRSCLVELLSSGSATGYYWKPTNTPRLRLSPSVSIDTMIRCGGCPFNSGIDGAVLGPDGFPCLSTDPPVHS
jgi:hypothetical protein